MSKRWTEEEDNFLIENYPLLGGKKTSEELYIRFGTVRTRGAISNRCIFLCEKKGLARIHADPKRLKEERRLNCEKARKKAVAVWTPEEDQFLLENYPKLGAPKTSEELKNQFGSNRSVHSIYAHLRDLHIRTGMEKVHVNQEYLKELTDAGAKRLTNLTNSQQWTEEEDNFLIENYPNLGAQATADSIFEIFGKKRTRKSIYTRIRDLRHKGRIDGPLYITSERMKVARKENGVRTQTEVGTILIRNSGEPWIKYKRGSDGWMLLSHYLIGENRKGKCVVHLNGDKMDNNLENLVCVDRSIMMRLNRHNWTSENSEVTKTSILLCELMDAMKENQ